MTWSTNSFIGNSMVRGIVALFLVSLMLFIAGGELLAPLCDQVCVNDCEEACDDCGDCLNCLQTVQMIQSISSRVSVHNSATGSSVSTCSSGVEKPLSNDIDRPPQMFS